VRPKQEKAKNTKAASFLTEADLSRARPAERLSIAKHNPVGRLFSTLFGISVNAAAESKTCTFAPLKIVGQNGALLWTLDNIAVT
jgi:hypothetical protein